jgi:flagellar basal-body rod protein FlgB
VTQERRPRVLQDLSQSVLVKAMDATAMRHRAISNNIANVETPGYVRQKVSFEQELHQALETPDVMERAREMQIDTLRPETTNDVTSPLRENGNNVDADKEMAALAENTLDYQAILQTYNMRDQMLRSAIYEGKR